MQRLLIRFVVVAVGYVLVLYFVSSFATSQCLDVLVHITKKQPSVYVPIPAPMNTKKVENHSLVKSGSNG